MLVGNIVQTNEFILTDSPYLAKIGKGFVVVCAKKEENGGKKFVGAKEATFNDNQKDSCWSYQEFVELCPIF